MDFLRSSYGIRILSTLTSILIFISCAEIAAPPGGEEDKKPPYLISSQPANGMTSAAIDNEIELKFSERIIQPPKTQKTIFISPRPSGELEYDWHSDGVTIKFPDSFQTDQTYIVSLGTNITDLRRNNLDSTLVIAFSTGASIDSGAISGMVMENDKAKSGVLVGLYDINSFENDYLKDSTYPVYISQTNQKGQFKFEYLPRHEYRLIAFEDRNNNELIESERESFAVPDREVSLVDSLSLANLAMTTTRQDTSIIQISAASYTLDNLIKINLSKDIPVSQIDENIILKITSVDDSSKTYSTSTFLERYLDKTDIFHFYLPQIDSGLYQLNLSYNQSGDLISFDNFAINQTEDNIKPLIVKQIPDNYPKFIKEIRFETYFSEPLDTSRLTTETFQLWDKDDNKVSFTVEKLKPFHIEFSTNQFTEGAKYRFTITEFEIADLAGNVMGDSLKEYRISIIDSDSVGTISGKVEIQLESKPDVPVNITFKNTRDRQEYNLYLDNEKFRIDLPAGKYLLSGYIDSNGNSQRDLGKLYPYQLAETYVVYPDTIAVRARFESSDINFIIK